MKCIMCENELGELKESFCSEECFEVFRTKTQERFAKLGEELRQEIDEMDRKITYWEFIIDRLVPIVGILIAVFLLFYRRS